MSQPCLRRPSAELSVRRPAARARRRRAHSWPHGRALEGPLLTAEQLRIAPGGGRGWGVALTAAPTARGAHPSHTLVLPFSSPCTLGPFRVLRNADPFEASVSGTLSSKTGSSDPVRSHRRSVATGALLHACWPADSVRRCTAAGRGRRRRRRRSGACGHLCRRRLCCRSPA